ncbi:hypothetical protein LDL59_11850 [Kaistella anthropi]|nr:hypothetical protein [Kaistella anthropi]
MELFKNFRENYSDLKSSIKLWETATEIEIYKSKQLGWINSNATQLDGNPIVFYLNPNKNRGIRVIQIPETENPGNIFSFWIDDFGDSGTFNGKELVFSLVATEENLEKYKKTISLWLRNENITESELRNS